MKVMYTWEKYIFFCCWEECSVDVCLIQLVHSLIQVLHLLIYILSCYIHFWRWPSPIPGVYSNSCPSSRWYHPTISSSVVPFSSRPQSFPASGSFPMSQFFTSGGQRTDFTPLIKAVWLWVTGLTSLNLSFPIYRMLMAPFLRGLPDSIKDDWLIPSRIDSS